MKKEEPSDPVVVVFSTFPDSVIARQIGTDLVKSQLVACVNITRGVESIYRWKGKVETAEEALAIFKTRESILDLLVPRLREAHPYDEPEIIALPVVAGSSGYLNWVRESTSGKRW